LPARVLVLLLGGLAFATICALLAPVGWPFELFAHFRAQYAGAATLIVLGLVAVRRPGVALLAAALALFHAVPLLQFAQPGQPVSTCSGPGFTVATVNLHYRNRDWQAVLDWLAREAPDLVVVQELTPEWAAELSRAAGYDHHRFLTREDAYGIGILSRWPFDRIESVDLAEDGLPSFSGVAVIDGRPVGFLGLHARWPLTPRLLQARDDALRRSVSVVRSQSLPTVVLGDFNLTPFSPAFARFEAQSGLRDAMGGWRWRPTWMVGFWPLALGIDHVLVPTSLCVERAAVGPSIGSDHRPVIARLRFGNDRS
jgi:endonuclease/exonuclease/phosphatase (EEP) superfamily protein YafD